VVSEILSITQYHVRPEEADHAQREQQHTESFGFVQKLLLQHPACESVDIYYEGLVFRAEPLSKLLKPTCLYFILDVPNYAGHMAACRDISPGEESIASLVDVLI
jgi:hypothetical protein